jgi:hypothetical protein
MRLQLERRQLQETYRLLQLWGHGQLLTQLQLQRGFEHGELAERLVAAVPASLCNQLKNKVLGFRAPVASKPERLAQVHLTDLGVGKDFFRSAGGDHRTLVDDVGPGAYPERFTDIMVSDQHADAALG